MLSRIKRLIGVLIAAVAVVTSSGFVSAQGSSQTTNGFRISPLRNEVTVEKGKSQTASVTVENPSNLTFKTKGVINDFIASTNEDGQPQLLLDGKSAPSHSLKQLVTDIPAFTLAPNERKVVQITITVPASAAAGGYYGAVRFLPAETVNSSNVSLAASVGSLFLVNVPGNIKEHLELVQFGAGVNGSIKSLITGGRVSIITRLKNDGDTHEKPFGKIQIKNAKGKIVAEEEINNIEPQANILPASIRKFETQTPENIKWFGRYTVTASYGYTPSNGELINARTSFWYIPLWLVIVFSVAVIAILFAAYLGVRSFRRKRR